MRSATTKSGSYCWVRPIIITVTPFLNDNFSAPLQTMSVLLNENNTIHAIVNMTMQASALIQNHSQLPQSIILFPVFML